MRTNLGEEGDEEGTVFGNFELKILRNFGMSVEGVMKLMIREF